MKSDSLDQCPLVFAIDKNFIQPFQVLLFSIKESGSLPYGSIIYVLHDQSIQLLDQNSIASFAEVLQIRIIWIDVSTKLSILPSLRQGSHVSMLTYARLYISSLLPESINSVLYIDSDTLVLREISFLINLHLDKPIAAADHCAPFEQLRLWGTSSGLYFQAGVLKINLTHFRQNNAENFFNQILVDQADKILWWDQDVFNIAYKNNWQRIPITYNYCRHIRSACFNSSLNLSFDPYIIHYDGQDKPWQIFWDNRWGEMWYAAYERTFGIPHPITQ